MMGSQSSRRRRFACALIAAAVVALVGASGASAVQTHQYDSFINSAGCPTGSPYLNNPAAPEVACIASFANHETFKIGKLAIEENVPISVGFALVPGSPDIEPEVCPGYECFPTVPGSTVVKAPAISLIHVRPDHPWLQQLGLPRLFTASIEAAGEAHAFSASGVEEGFPLFKLPIKLHLKGPALGGGCYIGSNDDPIELGFIFASEASPGFETDPNGFPVVTIPLSGLNLADTSFSVPAARGCGPLIGPRGHRVNLLDGMINKLIGLPSPSGQNAFLLADTNTDILFGNGGGATIQAAFEAAQIP